MSFLINPYIYGSILELARDTSFFHSAPNSSTPSSDSRSIGEARTTRRVYAFITWWNGSNDRTLSSATIGGVSATIHVQTTEGVRARCAIISANVPTGTTAVVACTFSGSVQEFVVAVISLDRLKSATPTSAQEGAGLTDEVVVDLLEGGYAMAVATGPHNFNTSSMTWTYLTESAEDTFNDGSNTYVNGLAYKANAPAVTGQTINPTFSPSNSGSMVCITVR